jgi:small subunit ribosomal protein S17
MDKTLVVTVERVKTHPIYKKRFVVRKKFYVHDEENQ